MCTAECVLCISSGAHFRTITFLCDGDEVKMRQAERQRHVSAQADVNKKYRNINCHGKPHYTALNRVRSTLFSASSGNNKFDGKKSGKALRY